MLVRIRFSHHFSFSESYDRSEHPLLSQQLQFISHSH